MKMFFFACHKSTKINMYTSTRVATNKTTAFFIRFTRLNSREYKMIPDISGYVQIQIQIQAVDIQKMTQIQNTQCLGGRPGNPHALITHHHGDHRFAKLVYV